MIKSCTCKNAFQDSVYGKGNRIFNTCKKGSAARCTSCGKEIPIKQSETTVEKVKTK